MNYKKYNFKYGLKGISKMSLTTRYKLMYLHSAVIPFYNNYLHYLKNWSDIITDYGSIAFVEDDGSMYEYCLLNKYNDNLEHHLYYFKNIRTKFRKTKIKHYCKKYDIDLKVLSKHLIYNRSSI